MDERDKLKEQMKKGDDYEATRRFVAQNLQRNNNEAELINFHYTPGTDPNVTKEQVWAEIKRIQDGIRDGTIVPTDGPVSSGREPIDLKELVKGL